MRARPKPVAPARDGLRVEPRPAALGPATLHVDGGAPVPVTLVDLSPRGCRIGGAPALAVATHVGLAIGQAALVSGRIAWRDGDAAGIDFCAPLLPKAVARVRRGAAG